MRALYIVARILANSYEFEIWVVSGLLIWVDEFKTYMIYIYSILKRLCDFAVSSVGSAPKFTTVYPNRIEIAVYIRM